MKKLIKKVEVNLYGFKETAIQIGMDRFRITRFKAGLIELTPIEGGELKEENSILLDNIEIMAAKFGYRYMRSSDRCKIYQEAQLSGPQIRFFRKLKNKEVQELLKKEVSKVLMFIKWELRPIYLTEEQQKQIGPLF